MLIHGEGNYLLFGLIAPTYRLEDHRLDVEVDAATPIPFSDFRIHSLNNGRISGR